MTGRVGYFFWGFLGDRKYNINGELVSTPDGNAFYSWSIISELQKRGKEVCVFSNRDHTGLIKEGENLFDAFAKIERYDAYCDLNFDYSFNFNEKDFDYIIIEWRWEIKGRNDEETKINNFEMWQPDLEMMKLIIDRCNKKKIPFVVFDLDYKLTENDIKAYNIKYVIELGNKWDEYDNVKNKQVKIPFDFSCINEFDLKNEFKNSLVYIGNRYERDWCIDKYIPEDIEDCIVYGNWKEAGRDSEKRWSKIKFGHRLQTSEMQETYSSSLATILLAKKEYCDYGFMTARIIEAIFYGCIPLFISEYGENVIREYAGKYASFLTVTDKESVKRKLMALRDNIEARNKIIMYLRSHLRFMDSKFFIDDVEQLLKGELEC
jgi:hypothetical protein